MFFLLGEGFSVSSNLDLLESVPWSLSLSGPEQRLDGWLKQHRTTATQWAVGDSERSITKEDQGTLTCKFVLGTGAEKNTGANTKHNLNRHGLDYDRLNMQKVYYTRLMCLVNDEEQTRNPLRSPSRRYLNSEPYDYELDTNN